MTTIAVPAGALGLATTDAEFINTQDMRLIIGGQTPSLLTPRAPGAGSLGLTALAPQRGVGLYFTGLSASAEIIHIRQMGLVGVAIAGKQSVVIVTQTPVIESPQDVDLLLSGRQPSTRIDGVEGPVNSALTLSGKAPTLIVEPPETASPEDVELVLAGRVPDVAIDGVEAPGAGQASIVGFRPTVIFTPVNNIEAPQNAEATFTSYAPNVSVTSDSPISIFVLPGMLFLAREIDDITGFKVAIANEPTPILSGTLARVGTMIENDSATTDVPTNYQIDDITGFKVAVDEPFIQDWRGYYSRKKSWSPRHPQDYVRGVSENQPGSHSPEPEEDFIEDLYPDGVSSDDL